MYCHVNAPLTLTCDHNIISFQVDIKHSPFKNNRLPYPNFKLADFESINNHLKTINWNTVLDPNIDLQQNYNTFISILQNAIIKHVPLKYSRISKHNKKPTYLKVLLKEKLKLYKQFKSDKSLKDKYKLSCKKYEAAVRRWHNEQEQKVCENPSSRKFYDYVNKKLKSNNGITTLLKEDDKNVEGDVEKADMFNLYFQKVFIQDNGKTLPIKSKQSNQMPSFEISLADISDAVVNSKDKISRTPENVPTHFIKRILPAILQPLHFIFNTSLKSNSIPAQWKSALVVPVFKKGNRNTVSNYRPVSLTSSFSRILESILVNKIMQHLLSNDLLSSQQFGFIPNRSTSSNLLTASFEWINSLSKDLRTNVIYTDVAKAFDTVSHTKLINTLQAFSIDNAVINWVKNFLLERTQQVVINDSTSAPAKISSGVPQGSVLGPCLFNIFYNDIVSDCVEPIKSSGNISLFADDMKLYSTENSNLQQSLNLASEWTVSRQLNLAPSKCVILQINKSGVTGDTASFCIGQHQLTTVQKFKDLGVVISQDLKWSEHVNYITRIASVSLYHIKKVFNSTNIWTLLKLYTTYVRPKLEYNTSVWSPYLKQNIDKIEKVQENFTKFALQRCNIPFVNYKDSLKKLNIKSLHHRRVKFDLILMYKIIHGLININFYEYFTFKDYSYNLRRHSLQIKSNFKFRTNKYNGCFFIRIEKYWNFLPNDVVVSPSLEVFRRKVSKVDLDPMLAD